MHGPLHQDSHWGNASTIEQATQVLVGRSRKPVPARLLPFLGPAFIASVAYMDPGNFATNIQAGAQFGYTLLWVVVASNLIGMLVQTLSAKAGIATGLNQASITLKTISTTISSNCRLRGLR